jgi:TatD DNase family protein
MIDTHTHLNDHKFDADLDEVVSRAEAAGVERIVVCGSDMPSSRRAVEIAGRYASVYATVGVHPHDAKSFHEGDLRELRELSSTDKVIAIGEIGLDFHYDFSPRPDQIAAFETQLQLAREVRLPVVVHSREAHAETVAVMKAAGAIEGCVFHCFSGDVRDAGEVLEMGFYIGVDGPVTFKSREDVREVVRACPADRLLIETDCPYLAPVPHRGERNEPAFVRYVCEEIARVRGIAPGEVAEMTARNARRLFGRLRQEDKRA